MYNNKQAMRRCTQCNAPTRTLEYCDVCQERKNHNEAAGDVRPRDIKKAPPVTKPVGPTGQKIPTPQGFHPKSSTDLEALLHRLRATAKVVLTGDATYRQVLDFTRTVNMLLDRFETSLLQGEAAVANMLVWLLRESNHRIAEIEDLTVKARDKEDSKEVNFLRGAFHQTSNLAKAVDGWLQDTATWPWRPKDSD